jgi:hypothetical protein
MGNRFPPLIFSFETENLEAGFGECFVKKWAGVIAEQPSQLTAHH